MFQQICEYEAQSIEFLKILEKEEFGAKVLDILRNTTDDETIGQLLRIVRISVDNSILKKSFRKPEFCECILKFMNNENLFVKTQFWKCITNITDENTCKITKIALTQALANVGESYTKVDVFRIFSFDFIGKLLFFDHSIVNILQEKQINEIVLRVICQFRDCTHLILSVFKYVRTSFGIPQMNDWNYKVFVPFMMATAKTSDRNTATASCYQMLCDLLTVSSKDKKMRKMLQNVHGWQSFSSNYLIPYIKLRDTNYGGPIIRKYDGLPLFLD